MRSIKMLFSLLTRDNHSTNAFNCTKYFTRSVTNNIFMNKTLNYASKSIVVADKAKLFTLSVNKIVKHTKMTVFSLIKIRNSIKNIHIFFRYSGKEFILKQEFCVHK